MEACWLSQNQEGQTEQIHPQTFDDPFFFDSTGMIYMHCVSTGLTVNKEYYVEVLREFRMRFGRKSIKTVPHPPYSPDLAPCDFWLFSKLRGCRYETFEERKEAVMKVTDTLTQEDFHGAF